MKDDMVNEEGIIRSVYCAIDEVNRQLPEDRRLRKSRTTCIAGGAGSLDSLQLIGLIVSVEEHLERICHVTVNLSDKEDIFSEENGALDTVETLTHYISSACGIEFNV